MKQSIHHLNVDCVHGHLEREMIQCVKKMAIYKHPLSPPLYIIFFGNVLSWLGGSCQKEKPFTVL